MPTGDSNHVPMASHHGFRQICNSELSKLASYPSLVINLNSGSVQRDINDLIHPVSSNSVIKQSCLKGDL